MKRMAISILLAVAISLPAEAGIFLDIPTIPGESTDARHPGEINVLSWGQSVANLNSMPVVLPLVFTHTVDKASPKLVEAALLGTDLDQAILTVTKNVGGGASFDYIILTLSQPKVVAVNSSGAEGGMPIETVTLTCASFELRYRETANDGSPGPFTEVNGSCGN